MEVGRLTGAFDLVTVAQLDVIEQARGRCDRLVARVRTDEQVERLEGLAPVMPLDERVRLVAALRDVDDVDVAVDDPLTTQPVPARPAPGLAYVFGDVASPSRTEVLRPRPGARRLPEAPELLLLSRGRGAEASAR